MKRIKGIQIQNFKAFQQEQSFQIDEKHVLIYGNNGSGKSSLFWALYTFLQSSIKENDQVEKYFKKYVVSDRGTHQTLKNVFMDENEDSFIKLTAIDTETKLESTYTISHDIINTNNDSDTLIQELNLASDFINYKLLQNFYRASHKQEVNLWPVFERDIFPFLTEGTQNWLDDIVRAPTLDIPRTATGKAASQRKRAEFELQTQALNDRIASLLMEISSNANAFLKDHFYEGMDVVRISLNFDKKFKFDLIKERIWDINYEARRYDQLHIKLGVEIYDERKDEKWQSIQRVQSFLNEAQLTRIAVAIRIGALRTRPLAAAQFKILVLDNMLISLDLSNRMDIVRIILNKEEKEDLKFFDGFQKFIFTHDKGFFNLIRRNTDDEDWVYFDFNKDENKNESPTVKEYESPLQLAIKNFKNNEFENAGNNLRLEAEAIFTFFLDPNMKNVNKEFTTLKSKINESYNLVSTENYQKFKRIFIRDWDLAKLSKISTNFDQDPDLTDGEKARLRSIQRSLYQLFLQMNSQDNLRERVIEDIGEILDRILNPASHHSENPLHRAELRDAIEKVKALKLFLKPI